MNETQTPVTHVIDTNQSPTITMKEWAISYLILMVPFVAIVFLFIWAFGSDVNPTKRNWARVLLIVQAISIVFVTIYFIFMFGIVMSTLSQV